MWKKGARIYLQMPTSQATEQEAFQKEDQQET